MRVYVIGPFKTATHTLEHRFDAIHNDVVRYHCVPLDLDPNEKSIVVVPLRAPNGIYPSAFFQNITHPEYPYCFSTSQLDVLNASMDDLISFYQKFDFSKFEWLSFEPIFESLSQKFGISCKEDIDLTSDVFFEKADPAYHIYEHEQSGSKIAFFHIKHLEDVDVFGRFANELGFQDLNDEFFKRLSNVGHIESDSSLGTKWYSGPYARFLAELKTRNSKE